MDETKRANLRCFKIPFTCEHLFTYQRVCACSRVRLWRIMKNKANSQDLSAASLKPRIIAVAADLLSQSKPIKLPTMREIAVSAGVSLGAAYRHFDSQEDLFLAVVTALFEELESHIKAAAQSSKQPRVSTSVLERCSTSQMLNSCGSRTAKAG